MRKYIAFCISMMPFNILRVVLYNVLLGFKISYASKVGIGTMISVRSVQIGKKVYLGRFNKFIGGFDLVVENGTIVGHSNEFVCTSGSSGKAYCTIGKMVHITNNHFFDASGGLTIKGFTRIAGRGSQFWTHGGQREETTIVINEKCYIGSAVRISQGIKICENSFIGLGSVVVDGFDQSDVLIFGNPAKIVKEGIIARKSLVDKQS